MDLFSLQLARATLTVNAGSMWDLVASGQRED